MRLKELTSRRWSIAMDERIAKVNRFTAGWMGYFQLADTPRVFRRWVSGFVVECGRSAGRNGNATRPNVATFVRWASVLERALPNSYWDDLGLKMFKLTWQRLRTAW